MFAQEFSIGTHKIGRGCPAFLIAEIGSNHDQSLVDALRLIDAAAEAGANAAKFQSIRFNALHLPSRADEATRALFHQIELREDWYPALAVRCAERGIEFLSSVTYQGAVGPLIKAGANALKIASSQFDIDPDVVACAARAGLPLIMSAGLADLGGIERMLRLVTDCGNPNVVLLHCIARYPAAPETVNLRLIETYARVFGCLTGFSDHTLGTEIPTAAVALGARAVEKHFTLDRGRPGPDHHFALEPQEFASMVRQIRTVEAALGDGLKPPLTAEDEALRRRVTLKWVTAAPIAAGERLEPNKLMLRRGEGGIGREHIDRVLSSTAVRDLGSETLLAWSDLRLAD